MKLEHKINKLEEEKQKLLDERVDEIAFCKWIITRAKTIQEVKETADNRLGKIVRRKKKWGVKYLNTIVIKILWIN